MIIKVCGLSGEGKTAVASFIERHLTLAGFDNVTVIDDDTEQYLSTTDLNKKLDALRHKEDHHIRIETVNVQLKATRNNS